MTPIWKSRKRDIIDDHGHDSAPFYPALNPRIARVSTRLLSWSLVLWRAHNPWALVLFWLCSAASAAHPIKATPSSGIGAPKRSPTQRRLPTMLCLPQARDQRHLRLDFGQRQQIELFLDPDFARTKRLQRRQSSCLVAIVGNMSQRLVAGVSPSSPSWLCSSPALTVGFGWAQREPCSKGR